MKYLSGIIRIILGCVVIGVAGYVYLANGSQMSADKPVAIEVLGQRIETTTGNVAVGIVACGAVGLLIIVFGIATMLRKTPAQAATKPPDPAANP